MEVGAHFSFDSVLQMSIILAMSAKIPLLLSLFVMLLLPSCEDKALVTKHKRQERDIAILRGELSNLKDRLDDKPKSDPSAQLESQERMVGEKKAALVDLEEELKQMKADRKEAEESFSEYKLKYRIGE